MRKQLFYQRGGIVGIILVALVVIGVLSYLGTSSFGIIVGGNQRINLATQSSQTLTQAAYTLVTETSYNSSGIPVALPFASGDISGGGLIPNSSAAPKTDGFGTAIGYCTHNASLQSEPVFAVVSAGRDKTFNTTCEQALVNNFQGDDRGIVKSVANILQGVGGTVYFGDPVNTVSDLAILANVKPGQMRTVLTDGSVWTNPTGNVGAASWIKVSIPPSGSAVVLPIIKEGTACVVNTDNSTSAQEGIGITNDRGNILTCQNGKWTPSGPPTIMHLTSTGQVLTCPSGWTEIHYFPIGTTKTGETVHERTCMIQKSCSVYTFRSNAVNRVCAAGWNVAQFGFIEKESADIYTYQTTCHKCSNPK